MENLETLEEASKEFANSKKWMDKGAESWVEHTFIEGAKWQKERMYSEEEVIKLITFVKHLKYMDGSKPQYQFSSLEILEQFKKQ